MELAKAYKIAERIVTLIRPACVRAEIAGSIRRQKSIVKDIEIVAIVNDYDMLYRLLAVEGQFIKPGVPEIMPWPPKSDAKYVRMFLSDNIKLDLFVGNSDNWGALFCMRTGSASGDNGSAFTGFVPALFSQWKKVSKGGRMVGCQPTTVDGLQLAVPEEQDFFDLLDVEWVEPKDRTSKKAVKPKKS